MQHSRLHPLGSVDMIYVHCQGWNILTHGRNQNDPRMKKAKEMKNNWKGKMLRSFCDGEISLLSRAIKIISPKCVRRDKVTRATSSGRPLYPFIISVSSSFVLIFKEKPLVGSVAQHHNNQEFLITDLIKFLEYTKWFKHCINSSFLLSGGELRIFHAQLSSTWNS